MQQLAFQSRDQLFLVSYLFDNDERFERWFRLGFVLLLGNIKRNKKLKALSYFIIVIWYQKTLETFLNKIETNRDLSDELPQITAIAK